MADISQAERKITVFDWDNFWKKFALFISVLVGIAGIIFVIVGYAIHTAEKIGLLEGQVQMLIQEKQGTPTLITPNPTITPTPIKG